ncbi:hypothetical protein EDB92DRAFT_1832182 [Lactarius akahatsu]|uniref:Uncharacterized protein n=1 Tax=Lactarius akahatsu TaxID=416441 RepID=A0AAD4LTS3_9AGAM|nr:hypothetical protein EDB92DRAFT_1832182 [Lactarius akahatsu]
MSTCAGTGSDSVRSAGGRAPPASAIPPCQEPPPGDGSRRTRSRAHRPRAGGGTQNRPSRTRRIVEQAAAVEDEWRLRRMLLTSAMLMRKVERSRKSSLELHAYNIVIKSQDSATFFGVKTLPQPTVARELLDNLAAKDMESDANYKLLYYMDLANNPAPREESAVVDFATHLLTLDIPLAICGQDHYTKTDVCVVDSDSDDTLLLIQEDKARKTRRPKDPEAQLIAGAIAAFQRHNYRTRYHRRDPIVHKMIPGITLLGTSPVFYKIPVTTQLAQSVELGLYPSEPTIVHTHLPKLARPSRRLSEGMKPLDNRAIILSCFEALKKFVNQWTIV